MNYYYTNKHFLAKKLNYLLAGLLTIVLLVNQVSISFGQDIPNPYQDWQLVWVSYQNGDEQQALISQFDVWEVNHTQQQVLIFASPQDIQRLQDINLQILVDQKRTSTLLVPNTETPFQEKGITNYSCYRTVDETYQTLENLTTTYPSLTQLIDYGDSWEKTISPTTAGHKLKLLQITNQSIPTEKPVFFLMGAIHARELTTAETATRFAEMLLENYGTDPDITWMVDHFDIRIAPITNPDGRVKAESGLLWRKNTHVIGDCSLTQFGVDLNRNASFHWNLFNIDNNPCWDTYAGPSAASEPETQALETVLSTLFPDQRGPDLDDPAPSDSSGMFITLHSYGEMVLWPWGDSFDLTPNGTQLQTLGRKLAFLNHYAAKQSVEFYPTAGATDDYVYGEFGVPAFTIEMGTDFFQDCSSFESTIWPDNRDALIAALRNSHFPYQQPAGPDTLLLSLNNNQVPAGQEIELNGFADDSRFVGDEATQPIQNARLSFDQPSWNAQRLFPVYAKDGSFSKVTELLSAEIDTGYLSPGKHTIFVESQDQNNNWGSPAAIFIDVTQPNQGVHIDSLSPRVGGDDHTPVIHQFTIKNIGLTNAVYKLSLEDAKWVSSLSMTQTPVLAPGESVTGTLTVVIPENSPAGKEDLATLLVEDLNNSAVSDQQALITYVYGYAVSLDPATDTKADAAGEIITYDLTITNLGGTADTFLINFITQHGWQTELSSLTSDLLAPGERFTFHVTVHVPLEAITPASDVTTVTVTSQQDSTVTASSRLNSRVYVYLTNIETEDENESGLPGEWVNFLLQIRNQGEAEDQFSLTAEGEENWEWELAETTGIIPAGEEEDVLFQVLIPEDGIIGDTAAFTITAQSLENPLIFDEITVSTTIVNTKNVYLPLLIR